MQQSRFAIGQIVHHRLFGYRGVIFDVDPQFLGEEEWYRQVARSRPPKDQPWYHVLVDGQDAITYVAERNLEIEPDQRPIVHPYVDALFRGQKDGVYQSRGFSN